MLSDLYQVHISGDNSGSDNLQVEVDHPHCAETSSATEMTPDALDPVVFHADMDAGRQQLADIAEGKPYNFPVIILFVALDFQWSAAETPRAWVEGSAWLPHLGWFTLG